MKKLTLITVVLSLLSCGAAFGENEISFELTADYFGKYVWRGQNLSDDPVFQPGASVSYGGFTGSFWGNVDTTKINNNSHEFTEVDYTLDYSGDIAEGIGYSVGIINYHFPSIYGDTTEFYWGGGFDCPLSPSVTFYHDIDQIKGTYVSFGIGHSVEKVAEFGPETPIGMDFSASLGWGSSGYNEGYWGIKKDKLNDLALSLSFPFSCGGGWTIAPSLNYVTLVDGDLKNTDTFNKASDQFFAGISLSKSF